jgi:hypothetical protein
MVNYSFDAAGFVRKGLVGAMQEKEVRTLAWFGSLVVFFPLWVAAQAGFSLLAGWLETQFGLTMPPWLRGLFTIAILGGSLLGVSYATAAWLNPKFPDSKARSASWDGRG